MRCCFHHQVHFAVRTGGQWVTLGSAMGYMHHVTADPIGACVASCEDRDALLNARACAIPSVTMRGAAPTNFPLDRNNPLAMRNPLLSFVVWNGAGPDGSDLTPTREMVWKFSTRGQFVAQSVNIAATTTAVAPQSMRFIDSLGQLAVVDGASQGLVLIDLNTVATAHAPYF
jgi:hypothetical protein